MTRGTLRHPNRIYVCLVCEKRDEKWRARDPRAVLDHLNDHARARGRWYRVRHWLGLTPVTLRFIDYTPKRTS